MLYHQSMGKESRTLLDLIQEFAELNESKTLAGGKLPPNEENRWAALKDFYDFLMSQDGLCSEPACRFSAAQIRETVVNRGRLRVHTDLETVVDLESDLHHARVGNLSCGGVLLLSDDRFEQGTLVTLHLANLSRGASVIPTDGQVVWLADSGASNGTFRYRMGIQFLGLEESEHDSLDAYVVDCLENKLLSLSRDALDAEFIRREKIALR